LSRDEHGAELKRSIESAEADYRSASRTGESVRDNSSTLRRLVGQGRIPELDPEHLYESLQDEQNLGRNEHDVYGDPDSGRILKITKGGRLGAQDGVSSYLRRIVDSNRWWDDDIRLEGVIFDPETGEARLLISQPNIEGRPFNPASEQDMAKVRGYFHAKGFRQYSDLSWWNSATETMANDVDPSNLLIGTDGKVYPIDLILAQVTGARAEMIENAVEARERMGQGPWVRGSRTRAGKAYRGKRWEEIFSLTFPSIPRNPIEAGVQAEKVQSGLSHLMRNFPVVKKAADGVAVRLANPDVSLGERLRISGLRARVVHATTGSDRVVLDSDKLRTALSVRQTLEEADYVSRTSPRGERAAGASDLTKFYTKLYQTPQGNVWHVVEVGGGWVCDAV
jgi:hypothetical protein